MSVNDSTVYCCANCGAPLAGDILAGICYCSYCKSVNAIDSNRVETTEGKIEEEYIPRLLVPSLTFAANHFVSSLNSQGGHIWLTSKEVYFQPHAFNIGNLSKRYIRYEDIVGYSDGGINKLVIHARNGREIVFVLWNKWEVQKEIESRRIECIKRLPIEERKTYETDFALNEGSSGATNMNKSNYSGCMVGIVALTVWIIYMF